MVYRETKEVSLMKHGILCFTLMVFVLSTLVFLPQNVTAEEAKAFVPPK
jgi:hypothetical protein